MGSAIVIRGLERRCELKRQYRNEISNSLVRVLRDTVVHRYAQ